MIWLFRVAYKTMPGESLHLEIESKRRKIIIPMYWSDSDHWEAEVNGSPETITYRYIYKRDGIELPEQVRRKWCWCSNKKTPVKILFCDDWCSAGTEDRIYQTKLFSVGKSDRASALSAPKHLAENTIVTLTITLLPEGKIPCLLGESDYLGGWNYEKALPMQSMGNDIWQLSLLLPRDVYYEYKYGLYDISKQSATILEEGENRIIPVFLDVDYIVLNDENFRRNSDLKFHSTGVAVPVFSLRSELGCGVGEFADLKAMADWAVSAGLRMIQVLPINDTSSSLTWTDSYPYSAISVVALHPLYLRLDAMSYLLPSELNFEAHKQRLNKSYTLDYEGVMAVKWQLSRQIYEMHFVTILEDLGLLSFIDRNQDWLLDYAAFCVNRDRFGTAVFSEWGEFSIYQKSDAHEIARSPKGMFYIWLQYELDLQLSDAVAHLHALGVALKGDLPIGVDRNSVDAWVFPELFKTNAQAGAPPDAFAVKGQNWGFPTYDWERMKEDGYAWWCARFEKLSRYFDVYRIDHILGFFRIWQVPSEQIDGIMGYFDPALPIRIEEFAERGINFEYSRYCDPFITEDLISQKFAEHRDAVCREFLVKMDGDRYCLCKELETQIQILHFFDQLDSNHWAKQKSIQDAVMELAAEVLLFEVPGSKGTEFHPRMSMTDSATYKALDFNSRWRMAELYVDYFFCRQERYWEEEAYKKLPVMRAASEMLLCGEDLGMVPSCVPGVMNKLGILSLEIQRWPKNAGNNFGDPSHASYLSVVTTGTHDMSTLRGWWREDPNARSFLTNKHLGSNTPEVELSAKLCGLILEQHLHSPAMWVVFPIQDIFAMDENIRSSDIESERINVPAITPFYWRWRMEVSIEKLHSYDHLTTKLKNMVRAAGRY